MLRRFLHHVKEKQWQPGCSELALKHQIGYFWRSVVLFFGLNSTNWHFFEGLMRFFGGLYLVIGTFFSKTLAVFAPAHLVTLVAAAIW